MRPRHEASENTSDGGVSTHRGPRFNEAEARGLGKPKTEGKPAVVAPASMRPRHEASENGHAPGRRPTRHPSFNEAEARGLGKPR